VRVAVDGEVAPSYCVYGPKIASMKSGASMSASPSTHSVMSASAPASASAPTEVYQYWITS
jgi:hypothetical protein